jgi:ferredoxin
MTRRKHGTIVACDVVNPSANVFASSMDTAVVRDGCDLLVTDIGDGYVLEAFTDKGAILLAKATHAKEADAADIQKRQAVWDTNRKALNKHELKCDSAYLPKLLNQAYDHGVWDEMAKTCFACGSCNVVCPTCYCFDVKDDVNWDMATGRRERCVDGCLLDGFTKVAGNHEFRKVQAHRFRHRLFRKAKYVPAKIGGQIACVGCGRCVSACLPNIANPVTIYNKLLDDIGMS